MGFLVGPFARSQVVPGRRVGRTFVRFGELAHVNRAGGQCCQGVFRSHAEVSSLNSGTSKVAEYLATVKPIIPAPSAPASPFSWSRG